MDTKTKALLWQMSFTTIYGWQFHPGNQKDTPRLTSDECALAADITLKYLEQRWEKWQRG